MSCFVHRLKSNIKAIHQAIKQVKPSHSQNWFFFRPLTICGIQQTTKDIDSTAISFAKALSSTVEPTSGCEHFTVSRGFAREDAREILLILPARRPSLPSALDTARLHQTIDRHRTVPARKIKRFSSKFHLKNKKKIWVRKNCLTESKPYVSVSYIQRGCSLSISHAFSTLVIKTETKQG